MYDPTNLPPAQPASKPKRRWGLILGIGIPVGLIALIACCGIGATLVSPNTKTASHFVTPVPSATRAASASPTQPPSAPPTVAAVATTKPAVLTPAQQLRAWYDAGGVDHLTAVSDALGRVSDTTQAGDIEGAKTAALGLGVAVKSAQGFAPMPDPTAQLYWKQALADYAASAQNLYVGLTTVDANAIQKATNEMVDGEAKLRLCTQRIHEIAGV